MLLDPNKAEGYPPSCPIKDATDAGSQERLREKVFMSSHFICWGRDHVWQRHTWLMIAVGLLRWVSGYLPSSTLSETKFQRTPACEMIEVIFRDPQIKPGPGASNYQVRGGSSPLRPTKARRRRFTQLILESKVQNPEAFRLLRLQKLGKAERPHKL